MLSKAFNLLFVLCVAEFASAAIHKGCLTHSSQTYGLQDSDSANLTTDMFKISEDEVKDTYKVLGLETCISTDTSKLTGVRLVLYDTNAEDRGPKIKLQGIGLDERSMKTECTFRRLQNITSLIIEYEPSGVTYISALNERGNFVVAGIPVGGSKRSTAKTKTFNFNDSSPLIGFWGISEDRVKSLGALVYNPNAKNCPKEADASGEVVDDSPKSQDEETGAQEEPSGDFVEQSDSNRQFWDDNEFIADVRKFEVFGIKLWIVIVAIVVIVLVPIIFIIACCCTSKNKQRKPRKTKRTNSMIARQESFNFQNRA